MSNAFPEQFLVIEAATAAGSVALVIDRQVVADRDVVLGASRDDALLPAIAEVLRDRGISPRDLKAIACGSGPGSFTSLRIAAALAKGFAVANPISFFAIPSLLLAGATLRNDPGNYFVHSDALRGDRYVLEIKVNHDGQVTALSEMQRLSLVHLDEQFQLANRPVSLVAVGASMVSAHDSRSVQPHARNVLALQSVWSKFGPVDVTSWEPDYGRAAEAQVKWEITHGQSLPAF